MRPDQVAGIDGIDHVVRWTDDPGEEVVLTAKNVAYVMIGTPSEALVIEDEQYFWDIAEAVFVPAGGGDPTNGGEDVARAAEDWLSLGTQTRKEAA
jgi:hypothetical protein